MRSTPTAHEGHCELEALANVPSEVQPYSKEEGSLCTGGAGRGDGIQDAGAAAAGPEGNVCEWFLAAVDREAVPNAPKPNKKSSCLHRCLDVMAMAMPASGLKPQINETSESVGEGDVCDSGPETARRRKEANDRAKTYLDAGGRVTHKMAWDVLSLWTCKRHTRRKGVRPDGDTHIRSDTLGVTSLIPPAAAAAGLSGHHKLRISQDSEPYPDMVRFLNKYFEGLLSGLAPGERRSLLASGLR